MITCTFSKSFLHVLRPRPTPLLHAANPETLYPALTSIMKMLSHAIGKWHKFDFFKGVNGIATVTAGPPGNRNVALTTLASQFPPKHRTVHKLDFIKRPNWKIMFDQAYFFFLPQVTCIFYHEKRSFTLPIRVHVLHSLEYVNMARSP